LTKPAHDILDPGVENSMTPHVLTAGGHFDEYHECLQDNLAHDCERVQAAAAQALCALCTAATQQVLLWRCIDHCLRDQVLK
jgi:hypothetical protein